jgi:Tol biopolymer transport system component
MAQGLEVRGVHNIFGDDLGARQTMFYEIMGSMGGFFQHPALSPDGKMVAFDFTVYDTPFAIWIVNSNGTGLKKVSTADDADPSWSPDGRGIAFVRYNDLKDRPEIWLMNSDGSSEAFLIDGFAPSWAAHGKIAFIRKDASGNNDVWTINADKTGPTKVTNTLENEIDVSWSPDGTKMAFSRSSANGFDIWMMNSDGRDQRQLTKGGGVDPSWSPDGKWIAFASDRWGKRNDIWAVRAEDGRETHLATKALSASSPCWAPDGKGILFSAAYIHGQDADLYFMSLH